MPLDLCAGPTITGIALTFSAKRKRKLEESKLQDPYGCAPFVSHALAAGGIFALPANGSMSLYDSYHFGGKSYSLNCCGTKDGSSGCQAAPGVMDILLAMGWKSTGTVTAGSIVFVTGSDGPFTHVVVGVGHNLVDAHNMAHYHVPISGYTINMALNPPCVQ